MEGEDERGRKGRIGGVGRRVAWGEGVSEMSVCIYGSGIVMKQEGRKAESCELA